MPTLAGSLKVYSPRRRQFINEKKIFKKAHIVIVVRRRNAQYFAEFKASCPPQEKVEMILDSA